MQSEEEKWLAIKLSCGEQGCTTWKIL